jgi:hypothetical protein
MIFLVILNSHGEKICVSGEWYEIARTEIAIEKSIICGYSNYTLKSNKHVAITDGGVNCKTHAPVIAPTNDATVPTSLGQFLVKQKSFINISFRVDRRLSGRPHSDGRGVHGLFKISPAVQLP